VRVGHDEGRSRFGYATSPDAQNAVRPRPQRERRGVLTRSHLNHSNNLIRHKRRSCSDRTRKLRPISHLWLYSPLHALAEINRRVPARLVALSRRLAKVDCIRHGTVVFDRARDQ